MQRIPGLFFAVLFSGQSLAFDLTSSDLAEGRTLNLAQVGADYGCTGGNLSPALKWKNAPAATRSFAVTVYDPDAPTGSGWWHWVVYDIPAAANGLPAGAGVSAALPAGTKQGRNDAGMHSYGGACPPPGDKPHRYVFSVYALRVKKTPCAGRCRCCANQYPAAHKQFGQGADYCAIFTLTLNRRIQKHCKLLQTGMSASSHPVNGV